MFSLISTSALFLVEGELDLATDSEQGWQPSTLPPSTLEVPLNDNSDPMVQDRIGPVWSVLNIHLLILGFSNILQHLWIQVFALFGPCRISWTGSTLSTLVLSETSIWEFWNTTGQQELSWLHRKETFIHVLHQALQGQQDPSVEGDVASLWYATGKWFLPGVVCWVCQALGQPPRIMGEWMKSHLSF